MSYLMKQATLCKQNIFTHSKKNFELVALLLGIFNMKFTVLPNHAFIIVILMQLCMGKHAMMLAFLNTYYANQHVQVSKRLAEPEQSRG